MAMALTPRTLIRRLDIRSSEPTVESPISNALPSTLGSREEGLAPRSLARPSAAHDEASRPFSGSTPRSAMKRPSDFTSRWDFSAPDGHWWSSNEISSKTDFYMSRSHPRSRSFFSTTSTALAFGVLLAASSIAYSASVIAARTGHSDPRASSIAAPASVHPQLPGAEIPAESESTSDTAAGSWAIEFASHSFSLQPGAGLGIEAVARIPEEATDTTDVSVSLSVSSPIRSSSALREVLDDPGSLPLREVGRLPLPIQRADGGGATEARTVRFSLPALANASSPEALTISFPATGVYLLRLTLRSASRPADALAVSETFVEFSFTTPAPRLMAALVAPVAAPPITGPLAPSAEADGPVRPEAEIERLFRLAESYEAGIDIPLSLAIQPSTLSDLVAASQEADPKSERVLASLLRNVSHPERELVSLPYSLLPSQFYSSPGLQRYLQSEWALGQSVLESITGRAPTTDVSIPPVGGFDLEALERTGELGFTAAVARTVDFVEGRLPSRIQPVLTEIEGGGAVPTFPAFDEVSPALSALDPRTLRLSPSAVAASLVVTAIESQATRGVVLLPPYAWNPDPAGLRALLEMLRRTPWIQPVRLSEILDEVPLAMRSRRAPAIAEMRRANSDPRVSRLTQSVTDATLGVEGLVSLAGEAGPLSLSAKLALAQAPSVALAPNLEPSANDTVARAESGFLSVSHFVRETASKVSIPPATGITLTSQSSLIPLRIDNALPQEIAVTITLQSDKLIFLDGERMSPVSVPPGGLTLNIPVEAQATGAFTLHVSVSSPDGKLVLVTQRFQIRCMRVGPISILLGSGALGVLLYWWVRQTIARRSRRTAAGEDSI